MRGEWGADSTEPRVSRRPVEDSVLTQIVAVLDALEGSPAAERAATVQALAQQLVTRVGEVLGASRVALVPLRGSATWYDARRLHGVSWGRSEAEGARRERVPLASLENGSLVLGDTIVDRPLLVGDPDRSRLSAKSRLALSQRAIHSAAVVPYPESGAALGWLEVHFVHRQYRWRRHAVLFLRAAAEVALHLQQALEPAAAATPRQLPLGQEAPQPTPVQHANLEQLLRYGHMVLVRTDARLRVVELQGDVESIFGMSRGSSKLLATFWERILPARERREVLRAVRRLQERSVHGPRLLSQEVRVRNARHGGLRWLHLQAVPLFDAQQRIIGWEGIGVDVTERRNAQEELVKQGRRIEALYEVARAIQSPAEPELVMLRGLRVLLTATGSDAALGCFYERATGSLEIVAADGVSQRFLDDLTETLPEPGLLREAVEDQRALLLHDLSRERPYASEAMTREGIRSVLVVPLVAEEEVLGAIVLLSRRTERYRSEDLELVSAAANNIALSVRQAEFYAGERRQADALGVLYRLSHELSKHLTIREVVEHAVPILMEECRPKRLWIGVINEQGTLLQGQAGAGQGMDEELLSVQLSLEGRHEALAEAVRRREPLLVSLAQLSAFPTLMRKLATLDPGPFYVVPLVSLGQFVGVVALEPSISPALFAQHRQPLLASLANELATVILARRFEAQIAGAEKMRMAGLLASGVAHNFNNLLQAVMGQASLIEMQLPKHSPIASSARMITEAAGRGAALIKQLLAFTLNTGEQRQEVVVDQFLRESLELYRSVLGSQIELDLHLSIESARVSADPSQLQQVVTNLLMNARDALSERTEGRVRVSAERTTIEGGQADVLLAPGSYLVISVEDNGIGMDHERRLRCFEPFFTTKNVDTETGVGLSGSGLGLSTAYSIVRRHNGIITVQSEPGRGSRFLIYLPLLPEARSATSRSTSEEAEVLTFGLDEGSDALLKISLDPLGARAVEHASTEELLESVRSEQCRAMLIAIDVDRLDGARGERFVRELRKVAGGRSILLMSGDGMRWRALRSAGAADDSELAALHVIDKPAGIWAMHALLRRALAKCEPLAHAIELEREEAPRDDSPSTQQDLVPHRQNGHTKRLEHPQTSALQGEHLEHEGGS